MYPYSLINEYIICCILESPVTIQLTPDSEFEMKIISSLYDKRLIVKTCLGAAVTKQILLTRRYINIGLLCSVMATKN